MKEINIPCEQNAFYLMLQQMECVVTTKVWRVQLMANTVARFAVLMPVWAIILFIWMTMDYHWAERSFLMTQAVLALVICWRSDILKSWRRKTCGFFFGPYGILFEVAEQLFILFVARETDVVNSYSTHSAKIESCPKPERTQSRWEETTFILIFTWCKWIVFSSVLCSVAYIRKQNWHLVRFFQRMHPKLPFFLLSYM